MKHKITFTALVLFLTTLSFGQIQPFGHLTIFSEDGDKFFLVLNGERINDVAQTNIRVEELIQPYYNAKIIFEDNTRNEISKNYLQVTDVDGIFMDVTYKIKRDKNNNKKMKLNFFSMIPVQQGFIPPSNMYVRQWGQPAPPPIIIQQNTSVGVIQQTTTSTTVNNGINAGVSVGGVGVNISINDPVFSGSTTVTETTTVSTPHGGGQAHYPQDGYSTCVNRKPMNANDFTSALATIKKQGFDDTRLKTAKQIAQSNCLNTNQIVAICKIFGFEDSKLDFAKFAYDACVEPKNYFKVNDVFSFSASVDELTDYISGR